MIAKLLELATGKDDVERLAAKGDLARLDAYLKTRRLFFPKQPRRFLDAASFTQDELLGLMEAETKELAGDQVELWILEIDGQKWLPAFSSQKKAELFSSKMSRQLNKVFCLGCVEVLLADVVSGRDIDVIDLNRFSEQSWQLGVRNQS